MNSRADWLVWKKNSIAWLIAVISVMVCVSVIGQQKAVDKEEAYRILRQQSEERIGSAIGVIIRKRRLTKEDIPLNDPEYYMALDTIVRYLLAEKLFEEHQFEKYLKK